MRLGANLPPTAWIQWQSTAISDLLPDEWGSMILGESFVELSHHVTIFSRVAPTRLFNMIIA